MTYLLEELVSDLYNLLISLKLIKMHVQLLEKDQGTLELLHGWPMRIQ